jgi:hypothetical protein
MLNTKGRDTGLMKSSALEDENSPPQRRAMLGPNGNKRLEMLTIAAAENV